MKDKTLLRLKSLVSLCIVFLVVWIFLSLARFSLRVTRETALRIELAHLRSAIDYFFILQGRMPEDLAEIRKNSLTTDQYIGTINANAFVDSANFDKEGVLHDPFKNKYIYDKETGRVFSETKGYENW